MLWFALGFLTACLWGWGCYHAGKQSAENACLKRQAKEYAQVDQVFSATADLRRDELLEQLHRSK